MTHSETKANDSNSDGKKKREPSAYAKFVKEKYDSVRDLPSKERFKKIAEMWKKHKAGGDKQTGTCRDEDGKYEKCSPAKKKRGRKKKE